jgi:hypothetical protein
MSETEFWQQETARRMAEYTARQQAAAARQQAESQAREPHWTQRADQHRGERVADERRLDEARFAASREAHQRAVDAKIAREGGTLFSLPWDELMPSPAAQRAKLRAAHAAAYAAQEAAQQAQVDALMKQPAVRLQRWRDFLATSAGQRAAAQHDAEDDVPFWFK